VGGPKTKVVESLRFDQNSPKTPQEVDACGFAHRFSGALTTSMPVLRASVPPLQT